MTKEEWHTQLNHYLTYVHRMSKGMFNEEIKQQVIENFISKNGEEPQDLSTHKL